MENIKKMLISAAKEVVENQALSEKTVSELEKPILPPSLYIKFGNGEWDRLINRFYNEEK
ncbi:MAG: hypothetical protein QM426_11990 [Euryarchaeota archaeon]|nr:hypothetical protein [Euryarchaeota archaeon]